MLIDEMLSQRRVISTKSQNRHYTTLRNTIASSSNRRILTHKNDWSRRHRRNDRNNALSVNAGTVRRDPNTVGHSTRTTDDRDAIYCRDHLSADALPIALLCMRDARTRIFSNVPYKYHNRKVRAPFVNDL